MCGICGIFNEKNQAAITAMLDSIKHRGPDSFDARGNDNYSFGGCRLQIVGERIIPLPSTFSDNLVFLNGEIYNYRELENDLGSQGISFEHNSEEAVIFKLFQKYGERAPAYLKGMFAIAIMAEDKLILVRDKFGIKPLYYKKLGSRIIFASEIKSILQHPEVTPKINHSALDELSVFGYIASLDQTLFEGIYQVSPGHVIAFESGKKTSYKFAELQESNLLAREGDNYESAAIMLYATIKASMAQMLAHGSQEKGFYLSGGMDSSLLASVAASLSGKPVSTFTLSDSEESEDLLSARRVAKALGANHHEFKIGINDYLKELPHFIHHYENIIAGGIFDIHGGIAFQLLSEKISKHVRVAFSGEGADELFGGYPWTYTHPLGFSDRIRMRLERFRDNKKLVSLVDSLFPQPEDEDIYRKNIFDFLIKGGLANYHLWSVDRSCSAFGFEVRPAYLYDDIADFALSLPIEYKARKNETKRILKDAALPLFNQYGISDVIHRQKRGMPTAVNNIASELKELAQTLITNKTISKHPFKKNIINPIDAIMFDLFFYIFFANKGNLPDGLDVIEFYKEGVNEDLYG